MSKIVTPVESKVSGRVVRIDVLERGIVVKSLKGFKNLILDNGLNSIGVRVFAACFTACAVGIGSTPPAVGQTALDTESARTANYLTGAGNCGTTRNSATRFTLRRTFDFPVAALNGNYTELGFSWSSAANGNLFSRVLIQSAGSPISLTVTSTQQLRVVYELYIDFVSSVQAINTNFGGAWGNVTGTSGIQKTTMTIYNSSQSDAPIAAVGLDGLTLGFPGNTSGYLLEPSIAMAGYICSSSEALLAIGSSRDRTQVLLQSGALAGYTNGTFFRDSTILFTTNQGNGVVGSFFATWGGSGSESCWAMVLNPTKTKLNTETLSFTFRKAWGRL